MRYLTALTVAALTASLSVPALAEGDAAAGERVYNRCKACHAVGEGARNRVGPQLNGIVGAEIASVDGFKYSKAFMDKKAEVLVWTEQALAAFLQKPRNYIPRTRMSFGGLNKEEDRVNVIAYMKTFK